MAKTTHTKEAPAWPWAMFTALLVSIPAFYDSMMPTPAAWATALYALSSILIFMSTWQQKAPPHVESQGVWQAQRSADWLLGAAMLSCTLLPNSSASPGALGWRLTVALATLLRLMMLSQPVLARAGLIRLISMAAGVLGLCGLGFYWIDPQINSLGDGLWLAFTTAATVGFGDLVPSTTASRIFSVFVVLLGYGVLSLVTATIAAMFVGTQERKVEREILKDLHAQLRMVRREIAELKQSVGGEAKQSETTETDSVL